tara:strand:+ start:413 stop:673 length:261 start_codon:yes stop_codon:yes gene_type:complete
MAINNRKEYMYQMKRTPLLDLWLLLGTLVIVSLIYLGIKGPTPPDEVLQDLGLLGPLGFVLDLVFVFLLYRLYKSRKKKPPESIWK